MRHLFQLQARTALRALSGALVTASLCACDTGTAQVAAPPAPAPDSTIPAGQVEALAETADPRTLYVLGNAYATGDGVEQDQNIAERLWRVACDKGHAYACSIYGSRQIEQQNYPEAARTLTLAAEKGVIDAIANLIELHDSEAWPGASADESVRWYEALQILQAQEQPSASPVN